MYVWYDFSGTLASETISVGRLYSCGWRRVEFSSNSPFYVLLVWKYFHRLFESILNGVDLLFLRSGIVNKYCHAKHNKMTIFYHA